jgi:chitinase
LIKPWQFIIFKGTLKHPITMNNNRLTKKVLALSVLVCLTISATAELPEKVLVGYWHNWDALRLKDIDDRYNVLMLSFLEADTDGSQDNNVVGDLEFTPYNNAQVISDIATVQAEGKTVIVSIGGANGSFKLNNVTDKNTFVSKVKSFIQTYGVDGIDIDLERQAYMCNPSGSLANPANYMQYLIDGINELLTWHQSTYGKKMILTTAPEVLYTTGGISPWGYCNGAFLPFIEQLSSDLDLLMIQLYNSGSNYSLAYPGSQTTYNHGTVDFIITQTEAAIEGFSIGAPNVSGTYSGIPASKVVVALPACSGAGGGYVSSANMKAAVNYLMGCGSKPGSYTLSNSYSELRGLMTWSANNDADASCGGTYTFAQAFSEISCLALSTKELSAGKTIIYPNPAGKYITVETANNSTLTITDASGKTVLTDLITSNSHNVDLSSFSPGVYFVKTNGTVEKLILE